MGHGKLRKFAENETFRCLLQPDASMILDKSLDDKQLRLNEHPIRGHWGQKIFGNDHPIVLELGCGKGDYTIALARLHPDINYIGVDIKGARLWKGAKEATEYEMPNVAFLRTRIEFIEAFFGPGEVSEIWLTFSDPQLHGSENSRLTSPFFLERYRKFLAPGGIVRLKTDSRFLYEYTRALCEVNHLEIVSYGTDIYREGVCVPESLATLGPIRGRGPLMREARKLGGVAQRRFGDADPLPVKDALPVKEGEVDEVLQVQTFYETMFLEMGLPITYLAFQIDHEGPYAYPGEAFDHDRWLEAEGPRRSFSHQPTPKR